MRRLACLVATLMLLNTSVRSADWPTWRHDPGRSGATDEQLAGELHLQWRREQPALQPAWPEDVRLQFDGCYEPVVAGDLMFIASSHDDSVTAVETATGEDRWKFHADGPVRFAPVVWNGRVYFGSDDGVCYCLDAETGATVWNFSAAPSDRLCIGNERLISVWPVRTGPVIVDGQLYFTVGVWPFEGTSLYVLDADTGERLRVDDLRDQSPQGYLVAAGERLIVPCGRSNALALDLKTGDRVQMKYDARGKSDYHVLADERYVFHGDKIFDAVESRAVPLEAHRPVIQAGKIYFTDQGIARGYDLNDQVIVETTDRRGEKVEVSVPRPLWNLEGEPVTAIHVAAGNRLYAHHEKTVFAIDLPAEPGTPPHVSWSDEVDGHAASMLVANGKLYVVTDAGTIFCFGADPGTASTIVTPQRVSPPADDEHSAAVDRLVGESSMPDGYCLVLGIGDGKLIDALVQHSQYQLIVIDPDASRVTDLRQRMDQLGQYGSRIVARTADPNRLWFPPYMASLITSGDVDRSGIDDPSTFARQVFETLRPYGGAASFNLTESQRGAFLKAVQTAKLPQAQLHVFRELTTLVREGALPGSGDWTHEYGDPANTLMSQDKLVKAPLGVLWFGGPSSDGSLYYDRHDWAPSMVVIDGRMFIQGPQKFTAVDVYTGRVLWQKSLPVGISPGRGSNWNASGYHFVAVSDGVYLTFPDKCMWLDPKSGDVLAEFKLPDEVGQWGRIRLWKNLLIVPVFYRLEGEQEDQPLKLMALNRFNGVEVWSKQSELGFPLIAIDDDRLFCYEGKLAGLYRGDSEARRGGVPVPLDDKLSIRAFDVLTGKDLWSKYATEPASWLSYSAEHEVVLMSNRNGIEATDGRTGATLWTKQASGQGFKGHPENYWDKVIIWKDQLLDQRGPGRAYNLRSGQPVAQTNPLTGAQVDWEFTKTGHHCNYAIASEFLMTFRADAAGFCDIATGETARLNGFRPGCRNSLIPANGVLNAPNFGFGCVCSYSLFTSLALVHVPEVEMWTYSAMDRGDAPIRRLGINLNAPGDRQDANGTPWLDYPSVGGPSPEVAVAISGDDLSYFRYHPAEVQGAGLNWVLASGVEGIQSLTIQVAGRSVSDEPAEERSYTVRLHFAEPQAIEEGSRVFDVEIAGAAAIRELDIVREATAPHRAVLKEVTGVRTAGEIHVDFKAHQGKPLLCGIEIIAEDEALSK